MGPVEVRLDNIISEAKLFLFPPPIVRNIKAYILLLHIPRPSQAVASFMNEVLEKEILFSNFILNYPLFSDEEKNTEQIDCDSDMLKVIIN